MERFQNGSLYMLKRKNGSKVWVFRWYDNSGVTRTYRKKFVGTVVEMPLRRDAEKAVSSFRSNINTNVITPETVGDLITHYTAHELTAERKAFASIETHKLMTARWIKPVWGHYPLSAVRTVKVEEWLSALPLAPASKTKIKSCFSVMYSHAIRYEWVQFNPILKVRTSSKPLREKDVLTPEEFGRLLSKLSIRDRAMALLAGSTGLRRSEFIALTWADVNDAVMEVSVTRSSYRNRIGETKTECSRRPVPLHPLVLEALEDWKKETPYAGKGDYLFASLRKNGKQPLSPDSVLKRSIKPAVKAAGISGKVIGWHNFRHSLATNLRAMGVDIKVAQELLRHANSRTTLDIYTRAVSSQKRTANDNLVELLLKPQQKGLQHPSAPSANVA